MLKVTSCSSYCTTSGAGRKCECCGTKSIACAQYREGVAELRPVLTLNRIVFVPPQNWTTNGPHFPSGIVERAKREHT